MSMIRHYHDIRSELSAVFPQCSDVSVLLQHLGRLKRERILAKFCNITSPFYWPSQMSGCSPGLISYTDQRKCFAGGADKAAGSRGGQEGVEDKAEQHDHADEKELQPPRPHFFRFHQRCDVPFFQGAIRAVWQAAAAESTAEQAQSQRPSSSHILSGTGFPACKTDISQETAYLSRPLPAMILT